VEDAVVERGGEEVLAVGGERETPRNCTSRGEAQMFQGAVVVDAVAVDAVGQSGFVVATLAREEVFAVVADDAVRCGGAAFGALVFGDDVDDLAESELAAFEISFVNGSAEALFVAEVDEGEGGMVSNVAGAGAFGWIGVVGIERRERAIVGVERVLEDGVGVFDVGDVGKLVVRGGQDRVGGGATFVEKGDPGARVPLLVEGVDVDVTAAVVGPEEKSLVTIEGEVGVAVIEGERHVVLVATFGVESDGGGRGVSFVAYVCGYVEEGSFWVGDDGGGDEAKVDFFADIERELVALLGGLDDPELLGGAAGEVGLEFGYERFRQ